MIKMRIIFRLYTLFLFLTLSVGMTAQNTVFYVSPDGTGDGLSWATTTTLTDALGRARAGDQIWVKGFEQVAAENQLYVAPAGGFNLKSGVQLYGGFKGDEANLNARETLGKPYQLKYRSVLSGDIGRDDEVDNTNLIFPANGTRADNAIHVLALDMRPSSGNNTNGYPTVVNGFTIIGGHASDAGGKGGGIYVSGDNTGGGVFRIERCFLLNNYAVQGGAVYVAEEVKNIGVNTSLINQSVVYNNAAGARAGQENAGGGIFLAGEGVVVNSSVFNNENGGVRLSGGSKVVNSTVARNTSGGIDMTTSVSSYNVFNSIVWGNSFLYAEFTPRFKNSAFHEVEGPDADGNIYVTQENRGDANAPMFDAPSLKTSFDREFNWRQTAYPLWSWNVLEGSVMHSQGDLGFYDRNVYGNQDMAGNPRLDGSAIDIGAYQFQPVLAGRIRYVKQTATGMGDGSSWENASGDLQKMIDELAQNNPQKLPGEVWVAEGTYVPQVQIISGATYSASFLMRDGISVYGGFAGTESSKQDRLMDADGMPWSFTHPTILEGTYYEVSKTIWNEAGYKWAVSGDSRHVVFFAPLPSEHKAGFNRETTLNGVTIRGGYAQGGTGIDDFLTDRGAGVYMGINAILEKCVVTENSAVGNGGGVYLYGGRVMNSLVYNNNADGDGGAVYVDNAGLVLASMLTNNSANNGAGIYLAHTGTWTDGKLHPEYLILSTSVVSNNTSRRNGAVYCAKGGVLLQNTLVNNDCPTATDNTSGSASQTGGLYIDTYGLVINSVLWRNTIQGLNVPMYAKNPTQDRVRFLYTALSGTNNAVWNNILQQEMIPLAESNDMAEEGVLSPDFVPEGMPAVSGVDGSWRAINYLWKPITGANLRARGMTLGTLPDEVIVAPEIDIIGKRFGQKPAVGAYAVEATEIRYEDTGDALKVYVDVECAVAEHEGISWERGYRSLNEAIAYMAGLDAATVENKRLEIHVLEGDLWPRYAFTNLDPKTATINIPATASGAVLYLYGGYHRDADDGTVVRAPLSYRSVINGNHEGKKIEEGLYHCITVAKGARVCLDGFHVINGYAAGEATRQYGAGLLIHDGAEVTVSNCIFENNTALEGSAIDARNATLTLNNCVVNNNTNITETSAVINCPNLTMNHVTVVNNVGAAPEQMGNSSFSAGNTGGINSVSLLSVGADGAKNFANPTNKTGATLGFDTYLGGYSEFRPLTSSTEAANALINKATGTPGNITKDITTLYGRDLGGIPDKGAYEANLPESGRVIYVRVGGTGDGLSWENAIGDINAAVQKGLAYNDKLSATDKQEAEKRAQVWVAAGTYAQNPEDGNPSCFVIEEGVDVFGGFPATGTPGFDDRRPLVSTSIYTQNEEGNEMPDDEIKKYETILQPATTTISTSDRGNSNVNRRVLSQRDDYNPHELGGPYTYGNPKYETNYFYNGKFEIPTNWDGFTIQNGFLNLGDARSDGGAGARIYENVTLKNCIIQNNENYQRGSGDASSDSRAGGVYSYGGSLINCYIQNNKLGRTQGTSRNDYSACYGGGVYLSYGTLYNCVIADNQIQAGYADGGGILIECGEFYNNTVINNKAEGKNRASGGLRVWVGTTMKDAGFSGVVKIYNSIIYGNTGFQGVTGNSNLAMSNSRVEVWGTLVDHTSLTVAPEENWNQTADGIYLDSETCPSVSTTEWNNMFADISNLNYRLSQTSKAINMAANTMDVVRILPPTPNGWLRFVTSRRGEAGSWQYNGRYYKAETSTSTQKPSGNDWRRAVISLVKGDNFNENDVFIDLFGYTDMDFTDRIKDCTIDAGAYERSNQDNVAPDVNGYYYVTQNGAGNACGDSPENAACAMKLQEVLNAAGERAKSGEQAIVRIAGYESASFVYHANTLSNPNDPQSYTYVIPYGVTVMGGYSDQDPDWDDDNDGFRREPIRYKTVLSAINNSAVLEQEVNGYHTVTFGEKPDDWTGAEKKTIIDGLYLIDGLATSMAGIGNPNTRGGGAIVEAWAHVRNCVVARCEAVQGGGLYVMPGGTVSGSLIMENSADEGAGVYADHTGAGADSRAHLVSCTITDNEASSVGGGLYLESGAMMVSNSVLWGNTAPSDKNISGVLTETWEDEVWASVEPGVTAFYPVNHCFVETYEMPSNFENTSMKSNEELYFASTLRLLKAYSPLIKHGMDSEYQEKMVQLLGVATEDMQGISRRQDPMPRVDAGAFAFDGGTIPTDVLLTRIFVSQGANVQLPDGANMDQYIGRSFYTSLTWLDDALEYIKEVRSNGTANENTQFEILLAQGTYKPSYRRTDASTTTIDQRQNSYVIPQGVRIYGGFSGTEMISSKAVTETDLTGIPGVTGTFTCMGAIEGILSGRDYSDFNQNGINEPWELANQVILSGNVNVSEQVKNVYHVVYSDAGENPVTVNPVVLDGLTVMDGETLNELSDAVEKDEVGRGGGIYSNGVSYVVNRCRLINNFAVRGGAVYIRDAKLTILSSILAGNGTVDDPITSSDQQPPRGGAVYVAGVSGTPKTHAALYAVNTLWVNNETAGDGGAIGTNYAEGVVTHYDPIISLMNNTFARNKAQNNAVIFHHNGKGSMVNTLMWGNESESESSLTDEQNMDISYSASGRLDLTGRGTGNLKLSMDNAAVTGPRFAKPSAVAGVAGNDANNQWNPAAISILTDAGDGVNPIQTGGEINGAYRTWMESNAPDYAEQYMGYEDYETSYLRYAGPLDEYGVPMDRPIDIGLYEYQYELSFPKMDAIYVATVESGNADGTNWANATSDIRGALVAMANPTGGNNKDKAVYIKAGEYSLPRISAGTAFTVSMSKSHEFGESLTVKGSYNESGVQDFSQPTVITTQDSNADETKILMAVATSDKPVTLEGLTFINKNQTDGTGIQVGSTGGKVTLKQVAFRGNTASGLQVTPGSAGEFLLVNTLFADGGTGLKEANNRTTVVNATFANNQTDLIWAGDANRAAVYNTVSWKNTMQNLTTDTGNGNVSIAGSVPNEDVNEGPNFRDPENTDIYRRDYRIRPSVKLLNQGIDRHYLEQVGITGFGGEKDLANNARKTDVGIDVGAYEYEAPLQPIVYVKADLTGTADGKSWETALGDLQGAVDLAGLYAMGHDGENGYVFVHGNYHDGGSLNLSLGNTKVYGGMNDERSNTSLGDPYTKEEVDAIVSDLLSKRKGMLENEARSSLKNLTVAADGVVDGFEITGTTTVNKGMLSTSVVKNDVGGTAEGCLYNSLVLGNVGGIKTVNVTATGTVTEAAGSGNNRASAAGETNRYVTEDYWKYQLMETAVADLDKGTDALTQSCMDKAGHTRDLIGNKRIRNAVDKGCFETWNIYAAGAVITKNDYPVGKSVVYVRKNQELAIEAGVYPNGKAFNPGFLLLEHQAGLRGNGNYITLTSLAVERDVPAGAADLAAMPFYMDPATSDLAGLTPKRYDGSIRAAYDYRFDANDGMAWKTTSIDQVNPGEGLLYENGTETAQTVRLYALPIPMETPYVYTEKGTDKTVALKKYNFNDVWSDGNAGTGNRFTHKENMSWNLFGSPYLCAMNYGDMEYGRVLYGYESGGYQTVNTIEGESGHIPAGSAVFAQTATLGEKEVFSVAQPAGAKEGRPFGGMSLLNLTLSMETEAGLEAADVVQLKAVEPTEARSDFDVASDGVKWMGNENWPQIYAVRNGGRYSLLSAVSKEALMQLGVTMPQAGRYAIGLPADCDADDYETVVLEDCQTGVLTDLKEGAYAFLVSQAGESEDRFRIYFNRVDQAGESDIQVISTMPGQVSVKGVAPGDRIGVYDAKGVLLEQRKAGNVEENFNLQRGIHLFRITTGTGEVVRKAAVR